MFKCQWPSSYFATKEDDETAETAIMLFYLRDHWNELKPEAEKHFNTLMEKSGEKSSDKAVAKNTE